MMYIPLYQCYVSGKMAFRLFGKFGKFRLDILNLLNLLNFLNLINKSVIANLT